jgi:hypothetical protein
MCGEARFYAMASKHNPRKSQTPIQKHFNGASEATKITASFRNRNSFG